VSSAFKPKIVGATWTYAYAASGGCGTNPAAGQNGNRTSATYQGVSIGSYCYDMADRLTSSTQTGYTGSITYDSRGNTTLLGGDTYAYDSADRHRTTTRGATSVAYQRDALDRVVERSVGGTIESRLGYTDGSDSAQITRNGINSIVETTTAHPGGVIRTKRSSSEVWSYPNIHGDITATATAAGANIAVTMLYDPYGQGLGTLPDNQQGNLDMSWLGALASKGETEPGINRYVLMGSRSYNAALGRFLQRDPVLGGGCADYEYVCADPVNAADPGGTCPQGYDASLVLRFFASRDPYGRPATFTLSCGSQNKRYGHRHIVFGCHHGSCAWPGALGFRSLSVGSINLIARTLTAGATVAGNGLWRYETLRLREHSEQFSRV